MVEIAQRSITRSPDLNRELDALRSPKGMSRTELGRQAGIGYGTTHRIFHPEAKSGVSIQTFLRVVKVVADTPVSKNRLCELAGIPVTTETGSFGQRMETLVAELGLNPHNQTVLESAVLEYVHSMGTVLQKVQSQRPRSVRRIS